MSYAQKICVKFFIAFCFVLLIHPQNLLYKILKMYEDLSDKRYTISYLQVKKINQFTIAVFSHKFLLISGRNNEQQQSNRCDNTQTCTIEVCGVLSSV